MADESSQNPYASNGGEPDDVFVDLDAGGGPDDLDLPDPPKWPKVVGILSIIWGCVGLLCNGVGGANELFKAQLASMMPVQDGNLPPTVTTLNPLLLVAVIIGVILSVLLIVAGAQCAARKLIARPLHLVWAVALLALFAFSMWVQLEAQTQTAQWVKDNPNSDFAQLPGQAGGSQIGFLIGLAVGVVLTLPYPIFCLIWFGVVKRTQEHFTGGAIEPAA